MLYLGISIHPAHLFQERRKECLNFFEIINKLARNLICDTCANLINFIKEIIYSTSFLEQCRKSKKDFTRTRLLPFTSLILYLCNFTIS